MESEGGERLRRVAESLLALDYEAWHFGDSVAFEGLIAAGRALGDTSFQSFAHGFVRGWDARRVGFVPLDCTAPGVAICEIHAATRDPHLLEMAIELAEYLVARPTLHGAFATWAESPLRDAYGPTPLSSAEMALLGAPGPGVFVDCLHFDPPFFALLSERTGDPRWLQHAVLQAHSYVELLQDPETGLFHHFWLERTGRAYILGWGRGQGWALLGLLGVIVHLPPGADRDRLAVSARRLIAAMVDLQRADGHWNPVVTLAADVPETSTAAFMAVGMRRAVRLGVVAPEHVAGAVDAAHVSVERMLDGNGALRGVSAAVWASTSTEHYRHVPTGFVVPWGQGAVALMLAEAGGSE